MSQSTKQLEVVKSPTGLHWWVIDPDDKQHPLAVRETRWQAAVVKADLQRLLDRVSKQPMAAISTGMVA